MVTSWANAPIPCSQWTGSCPHSVIATCRKGCSAARSGIGAPTTCPISICKENAPKAEGDPCQTDNDCRPVPAVISDDSAERVSSMRPCDWRVRDRKAPVVADWLALCTHSIVDSLRGSTTGLMPLTDPGCSGGVCMAAGEGACVRQGCTKPCRSDDECPAGSQCSFASCDAFESEPTRVGYCKQPLEALACRP